MRCLLAIDCVEPGDTSAPLQASVFIGAVAPGSASLSPSSVLYAPGMMGSADVTSYTTVDATFNGLRVLATPLLWDVLSWLAVPEGLQVTARPQRVINAFLSDEVLPMMIWAVNNMQGRIEAAVSAAAAGGDDGAVGIPFVSPTASASWGAAVAPSRPMSAPMERPVGLEPIETPGIVQPAAVPPAPAGVRSPSEQPVAGNAVRVRVTVNSPAVFLAEDLTDCTSPALGLTANMKAWVDMSPAGDMAVCLDADNVRGMRVECPSRAHAPAASRGSWPAYVATVFSADKCSWLLPHPMCVVLSIPYTSPAGLMYSSLCSCTCRHFRLASTDRADYLKPFSMNMYYAFRPYRLGTGGVAIPALTILRVSALQTIRGRLGYLDVSLMQKALNSFMGQSGSQAPQPGGPAPPSPPAPVISDPSALSNVMTIALPEVNVVITNDIGGTELPLAAIRIEDVHLSSLAWHYQNRQVMVAGTPFYYRFG